MSDMKHISKTELYAFQHDFMSKEEREAFLEHIGSCNYCSNQLAAFMSESLIKAPLDMKANILKATRQPDIQLSKKVRETSKRMQLFLYSVKVGAATTVAIILLLLSVNITNYAVSPDKWTKESTAETTAEKDDNVPLTAVIRDNMDAISNSILDFSNTIMKTEVKNND